MRRRRLRITLGDASTLRGDQRTTIAANRLGARLQVRGRCVGWDIDAASFGVRDYAFTGAANPLDMTGGRRLVAFAAKLPDHRGLVLTSAVSVRLDKENLEISRTGAGLSMKLQAKDCAAGGVFSDGAPRFVGRDSPQVATRVTQGCVNSVPAPRRPGGTATVDHCGGVSVWDVAGGGRMGSVFGEDATEVARPATTCTQDCQAQNQVKGRAVVLGFPFPVPPANRLSPRSEA
jgi:hypothetical protein